MAVWIFLGRSWQSDQKFVGLLNGEVTRARGLARVVPSKRWQLHRDEALRALPWTEKPSSQDAIESQPSPHAADVPEHEDVVALLVDCGVAPVETKRYITSVVKNPDAGTVWEV